MRRIIWQENYEEKPAGIEWEMKLKMQTFMRIIRSLEKYDLISVFFVGFVSEICIFFMMLTFKNRL